MKHLPNKQQGFTLLELLVVITLLAVLSVGALIAYEGVGDNAQATAAANNTVTADRMLRNYRAVTGEYPNQWDLLSDSDGGAVVTLYDDPNGTDDTVAAFGEWVAPVANTTLIAVRDALEEVGIDEFQAIPNANNTTAALTGIAPNLAHNESSGSAADEIEMDAFNFGGVAMTNVPLSIMPSGTAAGCTAGTISIAAPYVGTARTDSQNLNLVSDALEADECHLVIAVGFGHDVPGTTIDSSVAIAGAPTYTSRDINPATNYARYIALFHVGTDGSDGSTPDGAITAGEIRNTARLIGVVDPLGRPLDTAIAGASATN